MIKRAAIASVLSLVAASLAFPAPAATFTPDFPSSVRMTGSLTMDQGVPITCDVTLDGYVSFGGTRIDIVSGSFASGDWQCGWLVQPSSFPWTIVPDNVGLSTRITFQGMGLNTILGNCYGYPMARWSNSTSTIEFWAVSISGSPGACYIDGTLSVTNYSSPPITIQ